MIIPMLCVTIFVIFVVWFLLLRVARLMIHTPTVIIIQADEGIRDMGVTGVQTCALPIYFMGFSDINRLWELGLKVSSPGHSWTQTSHRARKNIEKYSLCSWKCCRLVCSGFEEIHEEFIKIYMIKSIYPPQLSYLSMSILQQIGHDKLHWSPT